MPTSCQRLCSTFWRGGPLKCGIFPGRAVRVRATHSTSGQLTVAMAVVKVDVAGVHLVSAAVLVGQRARRRVAQGSRQIPEIYRGLKLIDCRVRILNGGTEAVTRVLIESEDERASAGFDRGVASASSTSFQALVGFGGLQAGNPARRREGLHDHRGDQRVAQMPMTGLREAIHRTAAAVWIASLQAFPRNDVDRLGALRRPCLRRRPAISNGTLL